MLLTLGVRRKEDGDVDRGLLAQEVYIVVDNGEDIVHHEPVLVVLGIPLLVHAVVAQVFHDPAPRIAVVDTL